MPHYNLTKEDVYLIVDSLNNSADNSHSIDQQQVIVSLKEKLVSQIEQNDEDSIDVWAAFQTKAK